MLSMRGGFATACCLECGNYVSSRLLAFNSEAKPLCESSPLLAGLKVEN
jgi:hypothetical protein